MAFGISNTSTASSTANASSYTFSSQSYGAVPGAGETRTMVEAVSVFSGTGSDTTDDVSWSGNSGAEQVEAAGSPSTCAIWSLRLNTGTSGDIVVTTSGSASGCAVATYRLIDAAVTAEATSTDLVDSSGVLNFSMTTSNGWVGVTMSQGASTTTWSIGTETYDVDLNTNEFGSSAFGTNTGTPLAFTATNADTTPAEYIGCAASFVEELSSGARAWGVIIA